jgi:hypothetical protein
MNRVKWIVVAAVTLVMGSGCLPAYQPLAAHTLAKGENQDADVVWITRDGSVVLRCTETQQGPVCTTAREN